MISWLPFSMIAVLAAVCFALITHEWPPSPTSELFEGWLSQGYNFSNATTSGQRVSFHAFNSFSTHERGAKLFYKPEKELEDETFRIHFPGALSVKGQQQTLQWQEVCSRIEEGDMKRCSPGVDCDSYSCTYNLKWCNEWYNSINFRSKEHKNVFFEDHHPTTAERVVDRISLFQNGSSTVVATLDVNHESLRLTSWRPVKFSRGSAKNNFNAPSYSHFPTGAFHVSIDSVPTSKSVCIDGYGSFIVVPKSTSKDTSKPATLLNACDQKLAAGSVRFSYQVQAPLSIRGEGVASDTRGSWERLTGSVPVWTVEDVSLLDGDDSWTKRFTTTVLNIIGFFASTWITTILLVIISLTYHRKLKVQAVPTDVVSIDKEENREESEILILEVSPSSKVCQGDISESCSRIVLLNQQSTSLRNVKETTDVPHEASVDALVSSPSSSLPEERSSTPSPATESIVASETSKRMHEDPDEDPPMPQRKKQTLQLDMSEYPIEIF
jgi:hypothetical protein